MVRARNKRDLAHSCIATSRELLATLKIPTSAAFHHRHHSRPSNASGRTSRHNGSSSLKRKGHIELRDPLLAHRTGLGTFVRLAPPAYSERHPQLTQRRSRPRPSRLLSRSASSPGRAPPPRSKDGSIHMVTWTCVNMRRIGEVLRDSHGKPLVGTMRVLGVHTLGRCT